MTAAQQPAGAMRERHAATAAQRGVQLEISGGFGASLDSNRGNLLCLIAMMVILTVVVMIPMMVIGLLSAASPMLGTVLQIPVMAVFGGAIFALYCSIMYQAWREVFAAPGAMAAPANDTFAA